MPAACSREGARPDEMLDQSVQPHREHRVLPASRAQPTQAEVVQSDGRERCQGVTQNTDDEDPRCESDERDGEPPRDDPQRAQRDRDRDEPECDEREAPERANRRQRAAERPEALERERCIEQPSSRRLRLEHRQDERSTVDRAGELPRDLSQALEPAARSSVLGCGGRHRGERARRRTSDAPKPVALGEPDDRAWIHHPARDPALHDDVAFERRVPPRVRSGRAGHGDLLPTAPPRYALLPHVATTRGLMWVRRACRGGHAPSSVAGSLGVQAELPGCRASRARCAVCRPPAARAANPHQASSPRGVA